MLYPSFSKTKSISLSLSLFFPFNIQLLDCTLPSSFRCPPLLPSQSWKSWSKFYISPFQKINPCPLVGPTPSLFVIKFPSGTPSPLLYLLPCPPLSCVNPLHLLYLIFFSSQANLKRWNIVFNISPPPLPPPSLPIPNTQNCELYIPFCISTEYLPSFDRFYSLRNWK